MRQIKTPQYVFLKKLRVIPFKKPFETIQFPYFENKSIITSFYLIRLNYKNQLLNLIILSLSSHHQTKPLHINQKEKSLTNPISKEVKIDKNKNNLIVFRT